MASREFDGEGRQNDGKGVKVAMDGWSEKVE
jgi:hypothetical protein